MYIIRLVTIASIVGLSVDIMPGYAGKSCTVDTYENIPKNVRKKQKYPNITKTIIRQNPIFYAYRIRNTCHNGNYKLLDDVIELLKQDEDNPILKERRRTLNKLSEIYRFCMNDTYNNCNHVQSSLQKAIQSFKENKTTSKSKISKNRSDNSKKKQSGRHKNLSLQDDDIKVAHILYNASKKVKQPIYHKIGLYNNVISYFYVQDPNQAFNGISFSDKKA